MRENRLSDPGSIEPADYAPYIADGRCWVVQAVDGAILGFAALDAEERSVWALFVSPEAEWRGAGRMLLDALVAEARRQRFGELSLTTAEGTRAERLYRAAGWTQARRGADGMLLLRLALPPPPPATG